MVTSDTPDLWTTRKGTSQPPGTSRDVPRHALYAHTLVRHAEPLSIFISYSWALSATMGEDT